MLLLLHLFSNSNELLIIVRLPKALKTELISNQNVSMDTKNLLIRHQKPISCMEQSLTALRTLFSYACLLYITAFNNALTINTY